MLKTNPVMKKKTTATMSTTLMAKMITLTIPTKTKMMIIMRKMTKTTKTLATTKVKKTVVKLKTKTIIKRLKKVKIFGTVHNSPSTPLTTQQIKSLRKCQPTKTYLKAKLENRRG